MKPLTPTKRCDCRVCNLGREFEENARKYPKLKPWLEGIWNLIEDAETERDVLKAKMAGDWPGYKFMKTANELRKIDNRLLRRRKDR